MKIQIVKIKHLAVMTGMALAGLGGSGSMTPANALTFNFTPTAATSQQARDGFAAAGALWSSLFTDDVIINLSIDYSVLDAGTLGQASSASNYYSYQNVYNALNSDKTTADDTRAVNSLSNSSTYKTLINHTTDNPNGNGSLTAYTYDSNWVEVNRANAKALGLIGTSSTTDASISFNSLFTWDFDRSNGISSSAYDFVGVAAHEIGHALGFVSGVDYIDGAVDSAFQSSAIAALDLFRYSTASQAVNAIDITAGTSDKYFSLDNGVTKIASFSTGSVLGDGRQASHWKDNLGLGIMDPTSANGELLQITNNDAQSLDVIGWNRRNTAIVPEPADFAGTFICAAFGVKLVLKRRKYLAEVTVPERDLEV
ncbi:NF038122 family metalloprotease [Chamaesiphon sp. OTE_75_metabat_556]|uniref:NF038122 family metalloprotease n=1 Tax=Chamaesiphon sp. OTE_75_metabat_556 TaxID=2964692 RepID=UPI00286B4A5C|nr:NF038122 family metalloprotease [Chamaesiphon sp. OTE_75_metabat_556]